VNVTVVNDVCRAPQIINKQEEKWILLIELDKLRQVDSRLKYPPGIS